jgi:hypothetical protein
MTTKFNVTTFYVYIAILLIAPIAGYGVGFSNKILLFAISGLILLTLVIPIYASLPTLIIITHFSNLALPGLGRLNLYYILLFIYLIGVILFEFKIKRIHRSLKINLGLLTIWLLFLMAYRGVGLSFLGDNKIGGFVYFQYIASFLWIIILSNTHLSENQWRKSLLLMCTVAFMPFFVFLLKIAGIISNSSFILEIFNQSGTDLDNINELTSTRINSAANVGVFLVIIAVLFYYKQKKKYKIIVFVILGLIISGLSGFRGSIITIILFITIYYYLNDRIQLNRKFYIGVTFLITIVVFINLLPYMPITIQRSFAWLPFTEISERANKLATGTTVWRIMIWEYALNYQVPEYLFIGKGLAFSPDESLPVKISEHYGWAIRTLNYHSGPISLLVTLGLFGFVLFMWFFLKEIKRHYNIQKKINWVSYKLKYYHLVILSFLVTEFIFYIFVYGDIQNSIPKLLFLIGLCEGLYASESDIKKKSLKILK